MLMISQTLSVHVPLQHIEMLKGYMDRESLGNPGLKQATATH